MKLLCCIVLVNICPYLDEPENGFIVITGYLLASDATYYCNERFQVFPTNGAYRVCDSSGWSGEPSSCGKIKSTLEKPLHWVIIMIQFKW